MSMLPRGSFQSNGAERGRHEADPARGGRPSDRMHHMETIEVATEAARRGAAILRQYWEHLGREDADLKSRNDWVSRADRESEAAIVACIQEHFPEDQCLGEETGVIAAT